MTRDEALAVVRTAYPNCTDADEPLLDAIRAAVDAEREQCVALVERRHKERHPMGYDATLGYRSALVEIANAIRARGQAATKGAT